ncbi:MAG TPA: anaerobic ribonucleoside-triphosphate reductase activating protein [Candidatus Magasanikbacteria bacterium]|nr:anaerobic ribonucleoside-triphosphate reductase activating protein [Candidatus Magasanikbacteria bacterium]
MIISGIQKITLLDYPGKVAATIFTFGCNFRCGFCHNPELVHSEKRDLNNQWTEEAVLNFLKERQGLLEGLVVTGGEPTLHQDLAKFLQQVKDLGFLIKLDTNGTNSQMISDLRQKGLVDFWAMDIKNSFPKYFLTVDKTFDLSEIEKSIDLVKTGPEDYEFRTTIVEGLHEPADILAMAQMVEGAKKYVLQKFISRDNLVNSEFVGRKSISDEELTSLAKACEQWVEKCEIR